MLTNSVFVLFLTCLYFNNCKGAKLNSPDGVILTCDLQCILPSLPDNGHYTILGAETAISYTPDSPVDNGTILLYRCNPGYQIYGTPNAICFDGKWIKRFQGCYKNNNCVLPQFPFNGDYRVSGFSTLPIPGAETDDLTVLTFSCTPSYVLVGSNTAVCLEGVWSITPPICEKTKQCFLPQQPANGNYSIIGSSSTIIAGTITEERTALNFSCKAGYRLSGCSISLCIEGIWFREMPTCIENKKCVLPEYQNNGHYDIVGSTITQFPGDEVIESTVLLFSCEKNYDLTQSNYIFCHNKTWSSSLPECHKKITADCSTVDSNLTGVYNIQPSQSVSPFLVHCDLNLDGGKWTVIQSRFNGSVNFNRTYDEYTNGFGSVFGEYWLGLEKMHQLSRNNIHELYVELQSFDGVTLFARYSEFNIGDKDSGYTLTVSGHSGTAGDSLKYSSGMKFSTYDRDQDIHSVNCAISRKGAWWHRNCSYSNLNSVYHPSRKDDSDSIVWYHAANNWNCFKATRMLIRRKI